MAQNSLSKILKQMTGYVFVPEYRFHPIRRWRFDYANVETKTAIEIEGGVYSRGRHVRPIGYIKDMEKYNSAVENEWVVLRYQTNEVLGTKAITQINIVLKNRRNDNQRSNPIS